MIKLTTCNFNGSFPADDSFHDDFILALKGANVPANFGVITSDGFDGFGNPIFNRVVTVNLEHTPNNIEMLANVLCHSCNGMIVVEGINGGQTFLNNWL